MSANVGKKLTRRELLKAMGATAAVGVLAACAPAATPAGPAAPAAPAEKPEEKPAAAAGMEGKTGVMWGLQYDPHVEAYGRLAKLFNEKTGATLKVEPQGWPLEPKILAALSAGTQPDVACVMPVWMTTLIVQKAFMPLTDLVFKPLGIDPLKTWNKAGLMDWEYKGEYYGVLIEMSGVGYHVNVPQDEIEKLGLTESTPPMNGECAFESYEAMWDLAKQLQVTEGDTVTRWGMSSQGWDIWSYLGILDSLLDKSGREYWDPENEKYYVDTEEGVKAMELLVETPVKMGIETQLDMNGIDAALQGKVALVRGNGTPSTNEGRKLGYHYICSTAPKVLPPDPPLFCDNGSWSIIGTKAAKNQDIAVEFLKMMSTEEGQKSYTQIYGGYTAPGFLALAGKTDHYPDQSPDNPLLIMGKDYGRCIAPYCKPSNNKGWAFWAGDAVGASFGNVRQGKQTSAEAVKDMQAAMELGWKQFKDLEKGSA